ncbi:MAG: type II secretion system minor pseudopilin GspK [Pseudomonadales bacterium]|nr:type II secretion system minor pseudopilin GspK [Pseudomonadales bacterium]
MRSFQAVNTLKKQRGTILITVMLVFAVGAYMATEITYRQRVDIQRTSSIFSQAQAYEYVLGAEEIARFALRRDLKDDKKKSNNNVSPADAADEDWGMQLAQMVDGGTIEGQLVDLQGRFNLNWLLTTDADQKTAYKKALMSLMAQLKIPKEKAAQVVVDQIADMLDEDSTPSSLDGREDQEYMLEETPRRASNRMMLDISELMLIPALTPDEIETLAPYVTALPLDSSLNLNTASVEVMSSFDCLDAASIQKDRPKGGYTDINEATKLEQNDDCKDAALDVPVGLNSEFYELEATAIVNGKTIKVRSMLYRDEEQDSNIDVKVIYRRQVDPYSKV